MNENETSQLFDRETVTLNTRNRNFKWKKKIQLEQNGWSTDDRTFIFSATSWTCVRKLSILKFQISLSSSSAWSQNKTRSIECIEPYSGSFSRIITLNHLWKSQAMMMILRISKGRINKAKQRVENFMATWSLKHSRWNPLETMNIDSLANGHLILTLLRLL